MGISHISSYFKLYLILFDCVISPVNNPKFIKKFHCIFLKHSYYHLLMQVETTTKDEKAIKIPIAVLRVGEIRVAQSFLEFPDAPVTFKLIQGSGPVHIHGHHLLGDYDAADMDDLEEEGLGEEEVNDFLQRKIKIAKFVFKQCRMTQKMRFELVMTATSQSQRSKRHRSMQKQLKTRKITKKSKVGSRITIIK